MWCNKGRNQECQEEREQECIREGDPFVKELWVKESQQQVCFASLWERSSLYFITLLLKLCTCILAATAAQQRHHTHNFIGFQSDLMPKPLCLLLSSHHLCSPPYSWPFQLTTKALSKHTQNDCPPNLYTFSSHIATACLSDTSSSLDTCLDHLF